MESPVIVESANFAKPINHDTGFPFDDGDYDYDPDIHLRGRLNNLSQRIPGFSRLFDDVDDWSRAPRSFDENDDLRSRLSGQSTSSPDPTLRSRFGRTHPINHDGFFKSFQQPTDEKPPESPRSHEKRGRKGNPNLPQQLSNTVDLGQKQTPVHENRSQRSMSAPPENRSGQSSTREESDQAKQEPKNMGGFSSKPQPKERIIPIHIEGRDEPYIPKNVNRGPTENVFGRESSNFPHFKREPPVIGRDPPQWHEQENVPFNTPGAKHFGFTQQQAPPTQKQAPPTQKQAPPTQQEQQQEAPSAHGPSPPPASLNDPIEKIKCVKNDVLELMTQVNTFTGTRKDKNYVYLDEMLTRNLLKLDDIETEGKENIRQARKEAIKCIQSCINKLEEKAQALEKQANNKSQTPSSAPAMEAEPTAAIAENAAEPVNLNVKAVTVPESQMETGDIDPPIYESKATLFISGAPKAGVEVEQPPPSEPAVPVRVELKMDVENPIPAKPIENATDTSTQNVVPEDAAQVKPTVTNASQVQEVENIQ